MPEIEIRPAREEDLQALVAIDHSYQSSYVWQMDLNQDDGQISIHFREIRLPRLVNVEYPRNPELLLGDWNNRSGLLVGLLAGAPVGYISLTETMSPATAWVTDLAVAKPVRHQGIATAMILAAQEWASRRENRRMIIEMQSKNLPAIRLALKLGYEFSGYNDRYYSNQDIALFFAQFLR